MLAIMKERWFRRLIRHKATWLGAILIAVVLAMALGAPLLSPTDPAAIMVGMPFTPPGGENILGTDNIGRDTLSRIIYGARASLIVALGVVLVSMTIGVALGLMAGYYGGIWDQAIMFVMDSVIAFPSLILAMAISAVIGAGLVNIIIAVGVVSVPVFARLTRSQVLTVRDEEYITSARAVGAKDRRILTRYVLLNIFSPIIVQASFTAAQAILFEAALSFLGVWVQPPTPAWSAMLRDGYGFWDRAPWLSLTPGLAIIAIVLGFNLLGDALRDSLDVTLTEKR
jgi:peptide/nickel transport system permease protein